MRRFELVLVFLAAFAVAWPVVFGVRPRRGIVALLLVSALFAQLQFEGFRWQMIPLYLVAVGLAIGDILFIDRKLGWSRRVLRGFLGTVGLLLLVVLPIILPVPELPAPSGPDAIGTFTVQLADASRDEPDDGPVPPREFVAQVWYPARSDETGSAVPWSQDWETVAPAIAREMGLPSWFWNHTKYTSSHAQELLPPLSGTHPVLIYSHGLGGMRTDTLSQIEHLVSNGYIVIAPDHPYVAVATVRENGEIVYKQTSTGADETEDADTDLEDDSTDLVATIAGDISVVLTELEQGESGAFGGLAGAADLTRIGVYGHSEGGAAAIKVCLEMEQCSAVLAMDPLVEALTEDDLQQTMTQPALYMRSDEWLDTGNEALLRGIAARGEAVTYLVAIDGAWHNDFQMTPLISPLASQFGWKGPIPGGRVIQIVNNYLRGFFDVFLLETGSAALDSVTFDEVDVLVVDRRS